MKSICTNVAGGVVLALVLAQPAVAARGQGSYYVAPSFSDLDEGRTGALEKGEVQGRSPLYGQWDRFDTNHDGLIEPAEFAAFETQESSITPASPTRPGPRAMPQTGP